MDSDEIGRRTLYRSEISGGKGAWQFKAKAFKNAVRQCVLFAEADIIGKIKDKI